MINRKMRERTVRKGWVKRGKKGGHIDALQVSASRHSQLRIFYILSVKNEYTLEGYFCTRVTAIVSE